MLLQRCDCEMTDSDSPEYRAFSSCAPTLIDSLADHPDCIVPLAQRLKGTILDPYALRSVTTDPLGVVVKASKIVNSASAEIKQNISSFYLFVAKLKEVGLDRDAKTLEDKLHSQMDVKKRCIAGEKGNHEWCFWPVVEQQEKKKIPETDLDIPDRLPKDEDGYSEVFQKVFAYGFSLKDDVSLEILKIQGVESVNRSFSSQIKGYWPVIRITPNEEMSKEIAKIGPDVLIDKVVPALSKLLTDKYSKAWHEEDIEKVVEIATSNYPLKSSKLLVRPGDTMCTNACDRQKDGKVTGNAWDHQKDGKVTGNVRFQVNINGRRCVQSHYFITDFHCVLPLSDIPGIPGIPNDLQPMVNENEIYFNGLPYFDIHDGSNALTLLKATLYPCLAEKKIEKMVDSFIIEHYTSTESFDMRSPSVFQLGRWGLFGKLEDVYLPIFLADHLLPNPIMHPCTVDIAVLSESENREEANCSFEKAFSQLSTTIGIPVVWEYGPPDDIKGDVVFIRNGSVVKLSNQLASPEMITQWTDGQGQQLLKIPCCTWNSKDVEKPGDSGSAVFLQQMKHDRCYMYFLGGLITSGLAFPIEFSLGIIRSQLGYLFTRKCIAAHQDDENELIILRQLENYFEQQHQKRSILSDKEDIENCSGDIITCEMSFCMKDNH